MPIFTTSADHIKQGKTILASLIIDHCEKNTEFKTSYFYCRENDPAQNTCKAVCKCLLRQLIDHRRDLLPSCSEKRASKADEVLDDIGAAKALIELFCGVDMNQFIIIDGLDECRDEERKEIVQFLNDLVNGCDSYKPGKLRVLLVSRDLADMRKSMALAGILELDAGDTQKDIHRFVARKVARLQRKPKFRDLKDEDAERIQRLTCNRARGEYTLRYSRLPLDLSLKMMHRNVSVCNSRPSKPEETAHYRQPPLAAPGRGLPNDPQRSVGTRPLDHKRVPNKDLQLQRNDTRSTGKSRSQCLGYGPKNLRLACLCEASTETSRAPSRTFHHGKRKHVDELLREYAKRRHPKDMWIPDPSLGRQQDRVYSCHGAMVRQPLS